jgi:hypothetical protein
MIDRSGSWLFAALASGLASLLLAGCAALPAPFGGERRERLLTVQVEVAESPGEDAWSAIYRLPGPAAGVEMVRSRGGPFRGEHWSAAATGAQARWHRSGETERLCFDRPSSSFALSFRTDPRPRVKDYSLHVPYSDGGVLLYTGHLEVRPLSRCGEAEVEPVRGRVAHRWRFVAAPGRLVRVLEESGAGDLVWEPTALDAGQGTYVYFGPLAGVETPRLTLVIDPGLPGWLGREVETLLPRLFDHFAAETAIELAFRPLLLLSFGGAEGSGRSSHGGTLEGLIQVSLEGRGWLEESPAARRQWFRHLAHEAFHLWAGETLRPDHESEWLSEASAELFALEASRHFGVENDRQVEEILVDMANQCLLELEGAALLSAPERGAWRSFYTCGPVILHVAGAAVERGGGATAVPQGVVGALAPHGSPGLVTLFRHVFDEGLHQGGLLSTGLFLGWLDKLSGDRETVHHLQHLLRRGVERRADQYLLALLRQAGLSVSLVPLEEAQVQPELFRSLVAEALVRCACGEGWEGGGDLALAEDLGPDECLILRGGAPLWRVDEIDVHREPRQAWARLRSSLALGHPLEILVGHRSDPLRLLCPPESLDGSFQGLLRLE